MHKKWKRNIFREHLTVKIRCFSVKDKDVFYILCVVCDRTQHGRNIEKISKSNWAGDRRGITECRPQPCLRRRGTRDSTRTREQRMYFRQYYYRGLLFADCEL